MYIPPIYCMFWSCLFYRVLHAQCWPKWCKVYSNSMHCCHSWKCTVLYIIAMCVCDQYVNTPCAWANSPLQSTVKHALALLWLVANLNRQVGWVSLHLFYILLRLLPCWWSPPFCTICSVLAYIQGHRKVLTIICMMTSLRQLVILGSTSTLLYPFP